MTVTRTVDTPLERESLENRARGLASDPQLWLRHVHFGTPRVCVPIDVGPDVEAWLLMWAPGQGTGLHDHGGADGCFTVLHGTISELVIDELGQPHNASYSEGAVRSFDADIVHDVYNEGVDGAITLHVYRPVLSSMTHYEWDANGLRATETRESGRDW